MAGINNSATPTSSCAPRTAALRLFSLGANVNAIPADGKRPSNKWEPWQTRRQTKEIVEQIVWNGKPSWNGSEPIPPAQTVGIINGVSDWRCLDIDAHRIDSKGNIIPQSDYEKRDDGDYHKQTGEKLLKRPVPDHVVQTVLAVLGLPADYPWCGRSRSGAGWHIWFCCDGDLPAELANANTNQKESGVKVGAPADAYVDQFDHLELRWERCQTVLPSPDGYNGQLPTDAPTLVSVDQVVAAFLTIAHPRKPEPSQSRQQSVGASHRLTGSKTDRPDVIGQFNARYNVEDILRRNGYAESGGCWQHPNASDKTTYGVNILDGKAYSHHQTDLLNTGHVHDAFSAFCILEHNGDQKAAVKAAAADLGISGQTSTVVNNSRSVVAGGGSSTPSQQQEKPSVVSVVRVGDLLNAEGAIPPCRSMFCH